MCGRYAFYLSPTDLKARLGLENLINFPARYNCAPMQTLPIVVKNRMGFGRWGFRPAWSKTDDTTMASKMINARSETVAEKVSFKDSWGKQRLCLIPANGFYEWKKDPETQVNQPYFISKENSDPFYLAGLWSKIDDQVTFTILTKAADPVIYSLHRRMPVMIDAGDVPQWFSGDVKNAQALIDKAQARGVQYHKVASDVGKVSNDDERLIERLSA